MDRFPSLEREKAEGTSVERSNRANLTDPNHTREVIFALPGLQIHLKTEHLQNSTVPDVNGTMSCLCLKCHCEY